MRLTEATREENKRNKAAARMHPWPRDADGQVISSAHVECSMCSWAYSEKLGSAETPLVLKFANSMCHHYARLAGPLRGPQSHIEGEPQGLLEFLAACATE